MAARAVGIVFLVLLYMAVAHAVWALDVPFPPALIAMAVLSLFFVCCRRVPEFLSGGADVLVRLFPLFFIPPLVAVMDLGAVILEHAVVLLLAVTLSTLVGLFATAFTYRMLTKEQRR